MKKRYLVAGGYTAAGAALWWKLKTRPEDVSFDEYRAVLHHADYSRFADVEGARVHYQEAGERDAPPVLLIHGFTASNFVWRDVLLPLARAGYRVIAPDLIGFGFTSKPRDGEYAIEAQARMIVGLMDELGIERATFIGSSYGGAISCVCALDFPERVERLVLISPVTNDEVKNQKLLRLARVPLMGDVLSPLMLGSGALMRWRMKKVYARGGGPLHSPERMEAHHRPLRTAGAHRAFMKTLRRWRANRIEEQAAEIKQPTLLVWGENDLDVPLRNAAPLVERMPNARLVVFKRCGHLPQEEFPREFVKLTTEFLRDELSAPIAPEGIFAKGEPKRAGRTPREGSGEKAEVVRIGDETVSESFA